MPEQLYFIREKAVSSHIYFGCSSNFTAIVNQFISNCPSFDNKSHEIWLITINNSKYSCYDLHYIINQMSTKHSFPFEKLENTEFFIHDTDFTNLSKLLNKLSIGYDFEKIDVDELRNNARSYNYMEISENRKKDDDNYERILTNDLDVLVLNNFLC